MNNETKNKNSVSKLVVDSIVKIAETAKVKVSDGREGEAIEDIGDIGVIESGIFAEPVEMLCKDMKSFPGERVVLCHMIDDLVQIVRLHQEVCAE